MNIPKALVVGWPVDHARSPKIHGFWLKELGIAGEYSRAAVEPGQVAAFLRALPAKGYVGGNITVPHKEEAYHACDRVLPAAARAKAVNTFWFEQGELVGDNTDGAGFVAHLGATFPGWNQLSPHKEAPHILVLGAGGAARGLIAPLFAVGAGQITLVNRSLERAKALWADFKTNAPLANLSVEAWESRQAEMAKADLVINTTALGMKGQPPLPLTLEDAKPHAIIADIVYVPLETPFLAQARARGLKTLDGLGMVMHQAVPGFVRWFGKTPTVSPQLRALLVADLEGG